MTKQHLLLFLSCVFCSASVFAAPRQASEQPNIIFLLADDMGYGDLGCYGHPAIKTPHLDQLAREGLRLTDCYSASPNCSPARAAILTGRSPYRVGVYDYLRFEAMHVPESELTVAEAVKSAGYQTMFAGKWHCGVDFTVHPDPGEHGFDHWLANPRAFGQNPTGFFRNGKELPALEGWMSEVVVDEAITFIEKRDKSKPFMSMLWFIEPHSPVVAAEAFKDLYRGPETAEAAKSIRYGGKQVIRRTNDAERADYYGCVTMLDHHIGRLMAYLKEEGLDHNTLVIFTSDNGPEHRKSYSFGTPGPLRGAKGHMHEGGYRVPGIIKWPGKIKPGTVSGYPVNGTDYLPTLAAVAGTKPEYPKKIDGIDVMPGLLADKTPLREAPMLWWLFHARGGKEVSMRMGDYKMLANMLPQRNISVHDSAPPKGVSYMDFIKQSELGNFTLYNLRKDISESNDLSMQEPEIFDALRKQFIELHAEIRDEGPHYELK